MKKFIKKCRGSEGPSSGAMTITPTKTPKKPRHSKRAEVMDSPDEEKQKAVAQLLMGRPPFPARMWSNEALIEAFATLEGTQRSSELIQKVMEKRVTIYAATRGQGLLVRSSC